ncbi:MAG: hypothetical protein KDI06_22095 [Calditrichaeota bacterium]|nr:hypothetical protein [Calditrichota bacterium]HQU74897.1 hypothetical protein [Calditrichia bacterium]
MSFEFYDFFHVLGLMSLFSAFGAAILRGVLKSDGGDLKKYIAIAHGVGLLLLFISGFGMLARLGVGFPVWVIIKMVIWVIAALSLVRMRKYPGSGPLNWAIVLVLGGLAAWLAIFKPF